MSRPAPHPNSQMPADNSSSPEALRQRLLWRERLWVDPRTAEFLVRAAARGDGEISFIAACARTGRSAFYTRSAVELLG